ncbi:hypothetical protein LCG56_28125 (plasmid) [Pseudomonas cannabina pv. alisalensis]|uniref:Lipoprotein n=1 Tax=Pseudomonas syringae pv. maculicola str. ES4326 TaxID=629265 RepID=A0A8T8CBG4_PSEYM|nr:hypothetical protein [Pseudomonas syringae group genomosp. 3]QHF00637.1 hypothetical protein PMA4326_029500 [Pseudomonas syringae pv. maculicola str. ES4326]UBZ00630.1 hypothetical protein LCG56_28125 [Pseudomonas cannabina pv. alisalensis]
MVKVQALVIAMLSLFGCAADPVWVAAPPKAICFEHADKKCIGDLIAKSVETEHPGSSRDSAIRSTTALTLGAGIPTPQLLADLKTQSEAFMCLRPDGDFVTAGQAINAAREKRFDSALDEALSVQDPEARVLALRHIAALASRSSDDKAIGRSLNTLSAADKPAYMDALQQRLLTLLATGDIERANTLRDALLDFYAERPGSSMELAQIAISYATTGRIDDANAFLKRASGRVKELNNKDVGVLFGLVIKAAQGVYPPPQDFYEFSSDAMRLQAYVQLAILFDRSGQAGYARRVASDMARFAQKSSFRVDGREATTAFSKVLIEAM